MRKGKIVLVFVVLALGAFLSGCPCYPPEKTILEVNLIPQHRDWWCWAACIEMVSQYYGHRVDQCQAANFKHGIPPDCCTGCTGKCPGWGSAWGASITDIKNNWNHWQFNYQYKAASLDWDTLKKTISTSQYCGRSPIYVWWTWYGGGAHVVVAYGYLEDKIEQIQLVYVRNPWPPDCAQEFNGNCTPQNGGETAVSTYEDFVDDGIHKWDHSFYDFKYVGP